MSERTTPSAFTSWYVAALVLALAATFAVKLRSHGVFACPARYAGAAYLSDCNAAEYGDYDHGAFYFGLEPSAREAASDRLSRRRVAHADDRAPGPRGSPRPRHAYRALKDVRPGRTQAR